MLHPAHLVPAVLLAALAPASAAPAPPIAAAPAAAAARPAAPADVAAVLDRAVAAYQALATYRDEMTISTEVVATQGPGRDASRANAFSVRLDWAGPTRHAYRTESIDLVADGAAAVVHIAPLREFTRTPVPPSGPVPWEDLTGPAAQLLGSHPIFELFRHGRGELFPLLQAAASVEPAERDGRPGKLLRGRGTGAFVPGGEPATMALFFADETGLLEHVLVDVTPAYQLQARRMAADLPAESADEKIDIERATIGIAFKKLRTNEELPAAALRFDPPIGTQLVEKFSFGQDEDAPDQDALVGQPAPPIKATALDGQPLDLADYKGKVVVLDFWATWCGPCVAALPSVQRLHETYGPKGVVFLGMNQDDPAQMDAVRTFLAKRKVTFRQVPPDEATAAAYRISGIPCMVVIDREGKVHDITVGFGPAAEKEKAAQLEKLLASAPEPAAAPPASKTDR